MALFFPVLDWAVAAAWVVGSPALGYIVLRTAWPSSQTWNGPARAAASVMLGVSWSFLALTALAPGVANSVSLSPNQIAEFAGALGMGIILLTLLASLLTRFVWYRFVSPWNPGLMTPAAFSDSANEKSFSPRVPPISSTNMRSTPALRAPVIETESSLAQSQSAPTPARVYKPSQLKLPPARSETQPVNASAPKKYSPPPAGSSGSDEEVLGLLRDEAASEGKTIARSVISEEHRAPLSNLGEFAGFDATLIQLKRDLKDFNASMETHSRKKEATRS